MKNIFLTQEQVSLLRENIEHVTPKTIEYMIGDARKNGFDMLDERAIRRLLEARYNEILSYFNDDVSQVPAKALYNKLNKLSEKCTRLEENIRPQLEKLCYNTIVELFDIPKDEFELKCSLVDALDPKHTFHIEPNVANDYEYGDYGEITNEDNEVKKRKLINCFICGGASRLVDMSRSIYISELFDIDEELPHLYSKIFKINDLLLFSAKAEIRDEHHMQNGYCEVKLRRNDMMNSIESVATNFPTLLYETIKGVLELLASQGLPKDIEQAKRVVEKADILKLDPSNMRIGPVLWSMVFDDVETKTIPNVFHSLSMVKSGIFEETMNNIAFGTRRGKSAVEMIRKNGEHDSEYNNFYNRLMQKQSDVSLINDGYFLSEELDEM